MENFQIGIIGGTGGIGRWFADFFEKEGYVVHVSGRTAGMRNDEMIRNCPVVIVSVPINATPAVIADVGPRMPEGSLLMDLTSLKAGPVRDMLCSSRSEVMGCHPLFGPDVPSIKGLNVVMCPARIDRWSGWPDDLFRNAGANVFEMSPEKHDHFMSVVQVLNHLDTIVMSLALKETGMDLDELKSLSTPFFKTKLAIIEKTCTNNTRLYADIITGNPDILKIIGNYEKSLASIKTLVEKNDANALAELITSSLK